MNIYDICTFWPFEGFFPSKILHIFAIIIKQEDTIVFDSVSRMSRNAEEGFKDYKMLYEKGVHLVFLNEPLINTSVFDSTRNNLLNINIETGNAAVDSFFKGNIGLINNFMMAIAEEQIKAAFEQRRKTLPNSLQTGFSEISKERLTEIIVSCGHRPDVRGEKLSVSDFCALSDALYQEINKWNFFIL